jgi:hypothetical protein
VTILRSGALRKTAVRAFVRNRTETFRRRRNFNVTIFREIGMESDKEDLVRRRAYAIWEKEGRPEGRHDDHWRRAHEEMHGLEDAPKQIPEKPPHLAPAGGKAKSS